MCKEAPCLFSLSLRYSVPCLQITPFPPIITLTNLKWDWKAENKPNAPPPQGAQPKELEELEKIIFLLVLGNVGFGFFGWFCWPRYFLSSSNFSDRKTLPVWMKTEPEMFWKHVEVCFKSKQLVRNWGQTAVGGQWSTACGVISVSSRLAGTSSESFRPSLLTVTGLNSRFSNLLSGGGSWLIALNVSSTAPRCAQHSLARELQCSGNFNLSVCNLYWTECLLQRFVATFCPVVFD